MVKPIYLFSRGERALFTEVYFPKKVVSQSRIFTTLDKGYSESKVKEYLNDKAIDLLTELGAYPHLFDPRRYEVPPMESTRVFRPSVAQAKQRIAMYKSSFHGWSMYEVDGMFFNPKGKVYEERTQVIRLMFRFRSRFVAAATRCDAHDVLRSILHFVIRARGMIFGETLWSEKYKREFLESHTWAELKKRRFAERNYTAIVREANKWLDDNALFIFGYLVHQFSDEVLKTGRKEEEIWVTTIVGVTLNIIRRSKGKLTVTKEEL